MLTCVLIIKTELGKYFDTVREQVGYQYILGDKTYFLHKFKMCVPVGSSRLYRP